MLKDRGEYERIFDCNCVWWTVDRNRNLNYLKFVEDLFTEKLQYEDVTLNDVYNTLGFKTHEDFSKVGWRRNDKFIRLDLFELFESNVNQYDILIVFLGLEDLSN